MKGATGDPQLPRMEQDLHKGMDGTINTAEYPPRILKRYVDDTCVIIDATKKEGFLEHINSIDPHIQFTTEDAKADGSIPFLDTVVMPQPDNPY